MLRSTELNTFNMTNTIYRDLVCRANGGIYRLSGKTRGDMMAKHHASVNKLLPCYTGFGD